MLEYLGIIFTSAKTGGVEAERPA